MRSKRIVASAALVVALCSLAAVAWADLELGLTVNEGLSVMGGPLRSHMASPDGVTGASVDAITTASRLAHGGGVLLHLRRDGLGSLDLGLEYIHYRFDMDYEFGRASMDVTGLRVLAMARLALLELRGAPLVTFGFGAYLELSFYDEATLSGSWVNIELTPAGLGLAFDLTIHPYRFRLPNDRGILTPGIYARAYRGMLTQLHDELGSEAPLSSIALGLSLRYDFPE
jgi:hypothetical protein